jgi:imidazole glycerol-phosphate synthase subunit HisH
MSSIAIVDYGMGNLGSVANAFARLGVACETTADPAKLRGARAIVLPGVGAFKAAMQNLRSRGLDKALDEEVRGRGKPFLGICLGLQLIAQDSTEHGFERGLGWIEGHVERMAPADAQPVPHVGWNELQPAAASPLFERVAPGSHFFFDHSYHLRCPDELVTARCDYGGRWVAAVQKGHIHAVQFHPEKSQRNGLRLLRNFTRWLEAR